MKCNTGTGVNYLYNCAYIDDYVQQLGILDFCYTGTNNTTDKIDSIQKQLKAFETEIFASEQQALLAIKAKYNVSNEIWQKYMADLHRMKTIYTKHLTKKNPDIIHDPNIPTDIFKTLVALLEQNGINPHSIHIKIVTDQKTIDENPTTIAQAVSGITIFTSDASEQNFISYIHEPAKIEIFPRMLTETSQINIMSTCAHEIQHVIQNHTLTTSILSAYLSHYYNIKNSEFQQTPEYHTLAQVHEAQAEILSAIRDPKIAECLKTKRAKMYYPDHLYEEHFYHLAYINMLWQVREWLEKPR
jgi:hypothetical protein